MSANNKLFKSELKSIDNKIAIGLGYDEIIIQFFEKDVQPESIL